MLSRFYFVKIVVLSSVKIVVLRRRLNVVASFRSGSLLFIEIVDGKFQNRMLLPFCVGAGRFGLKETIGDMENFKWAIDTIHDLAALVGLKTARELREKSVWIPPEITYNKVNVDPSYYEQDGYGSTGVVIWDHIEALVQSTSNFGINFAQNASTMEALALGDGIRLALGHLKVIIESDAQDVRMLNEAKFSRADLVSLSISNKKANAYARSSFQSCSIVHINREANEAAHICAK